MAQAMLSAPKHADGHDDKPHHMMAVVGVRGGVGASMVATSLAWAISDQAGRQTALLDLDVHFGTGALTLDLEPGRGLIDAIDNPSRIDGLFIERAMVRARSEEHTSELQSLMRTSYAVFCLKKKKHRNQQNT